MGLVTGIAKIAQKAYRYIRYGKQVGKTAKNGNKVYKRGGTTTGVDAKGKVIHRAQTVKTDKYSTETRIYKPLPFDKSKNIRIQRQYDSGTVVSGYKITDRFGIKRENGTTVIQLWRDKDKGIPGALGVKESIWAVESLVAKTGSRTHHDIINIK